MKWRYLVAAIGLLGLSFGTAAAATPPSIWHHVLSTGQIKICVLPGNQPYAWKDDSGHWVGFEPHMAEDVARYLRVKPVFIAINFKTLVLDLQSGKCDVFFGFNATPERALAIDFAGPLYTFRNIAINRRGWSPPSDRWVDINNPKVRVCVTLGNSTRLMVAHFAPRATQVALTYPTDCALALRSDRADTYIDGLLVMLGLEVKTKDLGALWVPEPQYVLPSYAGMRIDSDGRFRRFLQSWAEYNCFNGNISEWIIQSIERMGVKRSAIPSVILNQITSNSCSG